MQCPGQLCLAVSWDVSGPSHAPEIDPAYWITDDQRRFGWSVVWLYDYCLFLTLCEQPCGALASVRQLKAASMCRHPEGFQTTKDGVWRWKSWTCPCKWLAGDGSKGSRHAQVALVYMVLSKSSRSNRRFTPCGCIFSLSWYQLKTCLFRDRCVFCRC